MAPELITGQQYNSKVDVWALGTVFYEMITGFAPFTGNNKQDLINNLKKGQYMIPKQIKLSLEGLDFLNACLQHDPEERMDWNELLKHSYLNYNWKDQQQNQAEDLTLSYMPDKGEYEVFMNNNPHQLMDNKNATPLNTKNPLLFQETYEKTLMKQMQQADKGKLEEQIKNADDAVKNLGQSQFMDKWDNQEVQQIDDSDFMEQFKQDPNLLMTGPGALPDQFEVKESGILADNLMRQLKENPNEKIPKKKGRKRIISNGEEDSGSQEFYEVNGDMDKQGAPESTYEESKGVKDMAKIQSLQNGTSLDPKNQILSSKVVGNVMTMSIGEDEEKKEGEMVDLANDSVYGLVTGKVDYTLKITDSHLNTVFGNNNFNLNSIYIQDDYMQTQKKKND